METGIIYGILLILVLTIGFSIVGFLIFREVINWYWKINKRIRLQHTTNLLLEKILVQLGANGNDEVYVEEIATGKRKAVQMDRWIDYKMQNPNDTKYRIVKNPTDVYQKNNTNQYDRL